MDGHVESHDQTVTPSKSKCEDDLEFDYEDSAFEIVSKVIEGKGTDTDSSKCFEYVKTGEDLANSNTLVKKESELSIIQFSNLESITDNEKAFGVDPKVFHKEDIHSENLEEWKEAKQAAEEEWSQVTEVIGVETGVSPSAPTLQQSISFSEAFEHFYALDLSEHKLKIRTSVQPSGLAALCHTFMGPSKIATELVEERDFIFTLALVPFQEDQVSKSILNSIYKGLTKTKVDCPRFGKHWETIGFQGNDPATDLRGCGMLALINILHFITVEKSDLANSIHLLSLDDVQNFPFSVMSINVTRITLQVLREGRLNKLCNKQFKAKKKLASRENNLVVFQLFQELYVAIFNKIYLVWKNEYKTMADSGFVMKDIETYALKNPLKLLKLLEGEKLVICDKHRVTDFKGVAEC